MKKQKKNIFKNKKKRNLKFKNKSKIKNNKSWNHHLKKTFKNMSEQVFFWNEK